MYLPDVETFRRLSDGGRMVPVFRERRADLETPVSVFMKLAKGGACFLLESVEQGEHLGRYSFIGINPSLMVECRGNQGTVMRSGRVVKRLAFSLPSRGRWCSTADASLDYAWGQGESPSLVRDPLGLVKAVLSEYPVAPAPGLPRFFGGMVGYLGYDAVRFFEPVPSPERDELGLPDALFMLADTLVIFDHLTRRMKVVVITPEDGYQMAMDRIEALLADLSLPLPPEGGGRDGEVPELASTMTPEQFTEAVRRAKEYIYAGDAFQVVLSHRRRRRTRASSLDIYRALRMVNPSPYMFYLDLGPFQLIGSSPEMLVRLEGRRAETRPIAGTVPRGATPEEDEALAQRMLSDPKERAEHVMLVDLHRNDMGRVCRYGTVQVPAYMAVERYSHVQHIVSSVVGELRPEEDAFSLLRACFPAGTLTGAPKVRAMEIIAELEGMKRGPYGGVVGYFGFGGNMDTCITIRTIVKMGEQVYLQAGAGIVADSEPEREWQETLNKAAALSRAVELAEKGSF